MFKISYELRALPALPLAADRRQAGYELQLT